MRECEWELLTFRAFCPSGALSPPASADRIRVQPFSRPGSFEDALQNLWGSVMGGGWGAPLKVVLDMHPTQPPLKGAGGGGGIALCVPLLICDFALGQ